jgi:hypothetical protein
MFLITISAIDWLTFAWLERNSTFLSAISTDSFMHFPRSKVVSSPESAFSKSHVIYLTNLLCLSKRNTLEGILIIKKGLLFINIPEGLM